MNGWGGVKVKNALDIYNYIKYYKNMEEQILESQERENYCEDCGCCAIESKLESRENGYFELIDYCLKCGSTFIS